MVAHELTQSMMAVGTVYHVRRPREERVLYTIRGVTLRGAPRFGLVEGDEGSEVGQLHGNPVNTQYEITGGGSGADVLATIVFPAVAFDKTLTLNVGGRSYEAAGGVFRGIFQCRDAEGTMVLEIAKALSVRDTFSVKADPELPFQVGLLAAVAIHSRFYLMVHR